MLNKNPIFILGFQHGGTNIVLNLLRSHPEVCSPRGELQEVFKGKGFPRRFKEPIPVVISKLWNYMPVLVDQRQDVFSLELWEKRKPLTEKSSARIDKVLFEEKLKARGKTQNYYKTKDVEYTDDEIVASRLLCKNLGGLIFLSEDLSRIYPDATFISIVRNGYAVCEGHIRRGVKLEKIATEYEKGCEKIIQDAESIPNYHIIRFEDLMTSPRMVFDHIFAAAGLDINKIENVRLENKKTIKEDGKHDYMHEHQHEGIMWYPIDEFMSHFDTEVNSRQIERLSDEQKERIRNIASGSLSYFSYTD